MDVHLSDEAARYIETHLSQTGCRSASEFVELLLQRLRVAEMSMPDEEQAWLRAQESAAARVWDNDADAGYDAI